MDYIFLSFRLVLFASLIKRIDLLSIDPAVPQVSSFGMQFPTFLGSLENASRAPVAYAQIRVLVGNWEFGRLALGVLGALSQLVYTILVLGFGHPSYNPGKEGQLIYKKSFSTSLVFSCLPFFLWHRCPSLIQPVSRFCLYFTCQAVR